MEKSGPNEADVHENYIDSASNINTDFRLF